MIVSPKIDEEIENILIEADPIDKKSTEEIITQSKNFYNDDLIEFENQNKSTDSIYDLGNHSVLIILSDGRNITSWDNISPHYFNEIRFISENLPFYLSDKFHEVRNPWDFGYLPYNLFGNVESMIIRNIDKSFINLNSMFRGCGKLKTIAGLET